MTKVSRFPLRSDVWDRIFNLFIDTVSDLNNKQEISKFIDDFYSPTEKIIQAKRLALMVLLAKGTSYDDIVRILKVSPSTISRMSEKVKYGGSGLKPVIKNIFKRESSQIMWKEIESLFNLPTKSTLKSANRIYKDIKNQTQINKIKNEF